MRISKEELENMTVGQNKVLVRISGYEVSDYKTASGIWIPSYTKFMEDSNNRDTERVSSADRIGLIEKVPDSLYYNPEDQEFTARWKTDIEVQEGDMVWFSYFDSLNSEEIVCEGIKYKMIDYTSLYVAVRKEEKIPLNGYVLLEEIKYKRENFLDVDEQYKKSHPLLGLVRYVGTPVQEYMTGLEDIFDVQPGDKVFLDTGAAPYLEGDSREKFEGKTKFRLIQRCNISAKI